MSDVVDIVHLYIKKFYFFDKVLPVNFVKMNRESISNFFHNW